MEYRNDIIMYKQLTTEELKNFDIDIKKLSILEAKEIDVNQMKKIFWIIENKDENELIKMCDEINESNMCIGLYSERCWHDVFTQEESKNIKVYMCGIMDFSPLQHACDIGWLEGVKILIDNEIGLMQGAGLPVIDIEKFLRFYNSNKM